MSPPSIPARSLLVLGGARSGKSAYAQRLAEAAAPQRIYLATGEAHDPEMAERIARHRTERGAGWTTREAPLALIEALGEEARPGRVALVDCLTLWLSNLMLAGRDAEAEAEKLVAGIRALAGPVIFVSNEVGLGIVPENALARKFRDVQGRANRRIASACDVVMLVSAGLPTLLKPAAAPALRLA